MFKKLLSAALALVCSLALFAQTYTGGVKGIVVSRATKAPVENAKLTLYSGAQEIATTNSDSKGNFSIPNLNNGMYTLVIEATEFIQTQVNVTVNDGYVKNMFNLSITPSQKVNEADAAKHIQEETAAYIESFLEKTQDSDWAADKLHDALNQVVAEQQIKFPKLAMPLRVALIGIAQSPSIDQVMSILGKEACLQRIRALFPKK